MAKEESTKIKKKRWYTILAPRMFGEKVIGESLLTEPKLLMNRVITCNLMSITNDVKNQNIFMKFIVSDVKENKGFTEPISYEVSSSYIRRLVRRGKERVDDSYLFRTKDNRIVRIKPFLLTNNPTNNSVLTRIRKTLKLKIMEIITQNNYEDIFNGVISYKIQRELKENITKIFPTRTLEIRVLKEEKEKAGKIRHKDVEIEKEEEIEAEEEFEDIDEEEEQEEIKEENEEEKKHKKRSKKKDADETSD